MNETTVSANFSPAISFIIFIVGFLARPIGAIWFGLRGDLHGYSKSIQESVSLLLIATALVGLLPVSEIGLYLLTFLRALQGVGLGGSYAAMAVYLFKNSPENQQGQVTSFFQMSGSLGYLIVLLLLLVVKTVIPIDVLRGYGWRFLFFLPILWLFLFRSSISLRSDKDLGKPSSHRPLQIWSAKDLKRLTPSFLLSIGIGALTFTSSNFKFYFLKVFLHVPPMTADISSAIATVLCFPFYYLGGLLADKFSAYKVNVILVLSCCIVFLPCYKYIELIAQQSAQSSLSTLKITACLFLTGALVAIPYGGLVSFLCKKIPQNGRATMFGLIYSVTVGIAGGTIYLFGMRSFISVGNRYLGLQLTVLVATASVLLSLLSKIFIKDS